MNPSPQFPRCLTFFLILFHGVCLTCLHLVSRLERLKPKSLPLPPESFLSKSPHSLRHSFPIPSTPPAKLKKKQKPRKAMQIDFPPLKNSGPTFPPRESKSGTSSPISKARWSATIENAALPNSCGRTPPMIRS